MDGEKAPKRQDDKTILELFSYAFLWWTCLAVCYWMNTGGWVSRRLANLPYVIWVAAYNTSLVLLYLLLDKLSVSRKTSSTPSLLEAINLNGLALFLLANVATGLLNLSVSTMYASDGVAMVILFLHSFVLCTVAWTFRKARLWNAILTIRYRMTLIAEFVEIVSNPDWTGPLALHPIREEKQAKEELPSDHGKRDRTMSESYKGVRGKIPPCEIDDSMRLS
ncbi:GWT1_1 [Sanghuangporus weigelae]